jgi:ubiquinone biosynthesis protein
LSFFVILCITLQDKEARMTFFAEVDRFFSGIEKVAWELRSLSEELGVRGQRGARLSQTSWMLVRLIADYRSFAIYSAFLPEQKMRDVETRLHARNARRFARTAASQRGAFLKVGQLLSARPDLLPSSWIDALRPLQDDAPAEPFSAVRAVVEANLGGALEAVFASFDETPLAAASIGQVHRARTRDGREVAVKVQRPGVRELVEHDLALLEVAVEAMRSMLPPADHATIIAEVQARVRGELCYRDEARAMTEMAERLAGMPGVRVPLPVAELCGDEVLTAELVEGERLPEALAQATPERRDAILGTLLEVYLRQLLELGRFQADPHPGNFLVAPDGALVLLDFGCTCTLSDDERGHYRALMRKFIGGDGAGAAEHLAALGFRTRSGSPDTLHAFAAALLDSFRRAAADGRFEWPTREQLLAQARSLAEQTVADPVERIPPSFVMIGRVFGTLGGLFGHHRPKLDWARVLPYLA